MVEGNTTFKIITGKSTGKRYVEKLRCNCEGNIRMDLKEELD